jgi:YfiH family protein
MESFRLGADGVYRCDGFQQFIWQEHGFGTRNASFSANVTLRQVHGDGVVNAHNLADREQEGDALITDDIGRSIGVRTADCVPILLLDSQVRAMAAIHAGWRGTAAEIVKKALAKMSSTFGTNPKDVYAAMGPCIRACCYEVGKEVADRLAAAFPEWGEEDKARRCVDLPEANRRHLVSAGVLPDRIFDSGLCTTCQPEQFYSYRREPENPGRMVSAICRLS